MYAIIDKRSPSAAKENLSKYVDDVFEFSSEGITYNSISGHPDVYLFQDAHQLIIAPNTPIDLIHFLNKNKVIYSFGTKPVGKTLNDSVLYNCLSNDNYFFCKQGKPDVSIQEECANKQLINLPQAYTRCSLFAINNNIVTSDLGIVKVLKKNNIDYFYFDPSQITIVEHQNGFIGGAIGAMGNTIFFLGNPLIHKDGKELHQYITKLGKEVVSLGSDYLYDGGGIFFVS